MSPRSLKMRSF